MKITNITLLLLISMLSLNATAANEINKKDKALVIQDAGAAAGDTATSYAAGSSVVMGVSAVSAIAGVALMTLTHGSGATTTTTTTSTYVGK